MRTAVFLVAFNLSALAGALPDDATLSRSLVGTWRGGRHDTRYFANGTWMMDPQNYQLLAGQNSHGQWRIKNGRLIETWRFVGESRDSRVVQEIISLTPQTLKFRTLSQHGPRRPEGLVLRSRVYTLKRIPDAKLPGEK